MKTYDMVFKVVPYSSSGLFDEEYSDLLNMVGDEFTFPVVVYGEKAVAVGFISGQLYSIYLRHIEIAALEVRQAIDKILASDENELEFYIHIKGMLHDGFRINGVSAYLTK